jgi:hypothetical protein
VSISNWLSICSRLPIHAGFRSRQSRETSESVSIFCLALRNDRRPLHHQPPDDWRSQRQQLPFSVGRHVESGKPDDNELILVRLEKPLSAPVRSTGIAPDTSLNRQAAGQPSPLISELDLDANRQTAQHDQRDLFVKLREAVARERIPQVVSGYQKPAFSGSVSASQGLKTR